jgi:hypothetical protein
VASANQSPWQLAAGALGGIAGAATGGIIKNLGMGSSTNGSSGPSTANSASGPYGPNSD